MPWNPQIQNLALLFMMRLSGLIMFVNTLALNPRVTSRPRGKVRFPVVVISYPLGLPYDLDANMGTLVFSRSPAYQ